MPEFKDRELSADANKYFADSLAGGYYSNPEILAHLSRISGVNMRKLKTGDYGPLLFSAAALSTPLREPSSKPTTRSRRAA
jgi:hypothetical protein